MHALLLTNYNPPLSQTITNLGPRPLKFFTFSTYKLAISKYNLNFKLMHNHLNFIYTTESLIFVKMKLTIILNFFLKACTTH